MLSQTQTKLRINKNDIISPIDVNSNIKITNFESERHDFNYNADVSQNRFYIHNRRYLGSKYKLLNFIHWVTFNIPSKIETVADIFAGTGIIADYFNNDNKKIIVNDILKSNYIVYNTFFSNDYFDLDKIKNFINDFNNMEIEETNYFSENFGNSFFTEKNAMKIGNIREQIEELDDLNFREKCILITSLLYATDKVANTCGHYDAYRRSLDMDKDVKLMFPCIKKNNKSNEIYNMDSNELVKSISADLVYIDPPYNSRQYGDTYHLLENLADWKKPEVVGIAKKMKDRSKTKSKYCTVKAVSAFEELIKKIDSKYILVSYSNMAQKGVGRSNAKISYNELLEILQTKGDVEIFACNYKAYTTGKSDISDHKELLYLCNVY
ncbi:DNA adenine methylase [Methanobrevibacter sp. TMH8]|uniref:DNA adenine methylase n=1 Tax=Methanobrevibacter sp. TMH8 TaxID=2848611 RepID=UPI001CCEF112|nr:DNA adenine methylase [Methanobrevibacter sp. TMH8]MBZ9570584.1 DNA adenine methylase [Methanobrevibacter sp. TMH8]